MRGVQNNTHTIIEFRRVLDTCDEDDYVLTVSKTHYPNNKHSKCKPYFKGDTVRVIWALHDRDPLHGAEMVYHGERKGSQSLHLLGPPPIPKTQVEKPKHWDVVFENVSYNL